MNIKQLKIKLKELQTNLQNKRVQKILVNETYDIKALEKSIQLYYENIEQVKDEELLKVIEQKVTELINHSNNSNFVGYAHQFINAANFLISNTPQELSIGEDNLVDNVKISEEEFFKRCKKLIEQLGYEHEEPKLILKTQVTGKKFKIFKNKNDSIIYFAENSVKGMPVSLNSLKEIAFNMKEPNHKSYDNVVISKIFDNTIFDEFDNTFDAQLNESLINQIRKHSEELLIVKDKLEEIQQENKTIEEQKQQFNEVIEKSENLDSKIKAAEDKAKLGASISYWAGKQKTHKKKFYQYSIMAVTLIALLVLILFFVVDSHNNQKTEDNKVVTNVTQTTKAVENKNKKNNDKNETKAKIEKEKVETTTLNNSQNFDLSKLGWYVFMIFTSSSVFWIIRITVKIALSNLHLSEDAYERVVMIQTYLSFVQEGEINEKDKDLILSSLFRPSNIGIIKDESSVTITDIISAVKK